MNASDRARYSRFQPRPELSEGEQVSAQCAARTCLRTAQAAVEAARAARANATPPEPTEETP